MDSGIALVIGALIALAGSVAAPWLRDSLERSHRSAAEHRIAVSSSLRRFTAAAPDLALSVNVNKTVQLVNPTAPQDLEGARQQLQAANDLLRASSEMEAAIYELGLLLQPKDAPIELMARMVFEALHQNNYGIAMGAFGLASAGWFRGQLNAEDALSKYRGIADGQANRASSCAHGVSPEPHPVEPVDV